MYLFFIHWSYFIIYHVWTPHQEIIQEETEKSFYGEEDSDEDEKNDNEEGEVQRKPYVMDQDHRLLLRSAKPLLQSRNAAVSN